jgi:peptidoglycan-N-acetylglucosamine deacetylase
MNTTNRKKGFFIGIVFVIVVVILTLVYLERQRESGEMVPEQELPIVEEDEIGEFVVTHTIQEIERGVFEIDLHYPHFATTTGGFVTINQIIEQEMSDMAVGFRNDAGSFGEEFGQAGMKSVLSSEYRIIESVNENILGVEFLVYQYMSGAAHPLSVYRTLNFNTETGNQLFLNDIFDTDYLTVLSQISRSMLLEKLQDRSDEETIRMGTMPEPDYFGEFLLKPEGFELIFNVYQVAPYAAGPQRVIIPYEELRNVLRRNVLS